MVLAAGPGTRLRPLTYRVPKPMIPVLGRPVMAHVLDGLDRHGIEPAITNLHSRVGAISDYFGDRIAYRVEEKLLGTAGGVRNCADVLRDERFLVVSGTALTDVDLSALVARHEAAGAVATLAVKRVGDLPGHDVVLHDREGRVTGFQQAPDPAESLGQTANCGIYVFEPEVFDFIPEGPAVDWVADVLPAVLDSGAALHAHEIDGYWNGLETFDALIAATFDALRGIPGIPVDGDRLDEGLTVGAGSTMTGVTMIEPPVWIGADVEIGTEVRLQGPLVIGDGARIGEGASLRSAVVLPGTNVPDGALLAGGIVGSRAGS
jgi:mannose-1-phosphate guanylyltransferase/mannose-1-phosphate guanylyltransferase/phosphomannomutase